MSFFLSVNKFNLLSFFLIFIDFGTVHVWLGKLSCHFILGNG